VPQPEDRGILLRDILESGEAYQEKSYCITATEWKGSSLEHNLQKHVRTQIAEPVRIGQVEGSKGGQGQRIYSCDGKAVCQSANGGGPGAKTGLYACPLLVVPEATRKGYTEIMPGDCVDMTQPNSKTRRGRNMKDKCNCLMTGNHYYQYCGTTDKPIYEVKDGLITIKGKQYPIKLVDGYYIIRKLTVTECCRLQTLPDDYCRAVSNSQAYKGLGNGWTAEVIIHILKHMNIPLDEEIVVLSMYDGIGTGRYCLDKLGYKNIKYFGYEIDKYAMQVAMSNYSDIIQCGDAFQVREDGWGIGRR
jgi:DNA (cytosine-5)-methyltransferase 3A